MKIYLDVCCFNRPFDDQSQLRVRLESEAKLAVQERIRSGHIQLGWSYMMDFENEANPYEERRLSIASWRGMATSDVSESPGILTLAKELNERGFKSKDALHLACAKQPTFNSNLKSLLQKKTCAAPLNLDVKLFLLATMEF